MEIHGILQKTRSEVESKKSELRELVGDHYRSVLESSDHIRAMSECASMVAQKAEKADELIATMRELAASPPVEVGEGSPAADDSEFLLCERLAELLDLPERVRDLVADFSFVEAARVALVDAPSLQAEVQQLLDASASPLPGFDVHGLIAQQAAFYRSLPRQVASGCVDAFDEAELTPSGSAEAFVAHLLLDDAAQHDELLRRFVERRSALLHHILDSPAAAFGGDAIEGCLARLVSAAKTFEGTVVLASGLCSSSGGGALPPLLAAALKRLADSRETSASSQLKQKVQAVTALFQRSGAGSAAATLGKLGSAFAKTWVPQEGTEHFGGIKTMPGRFQALIGGFASQSCTHLGDLQRQFAQQVAAFRRSLMEPIGHGDSLDWLATWSGACGIFCPSQGVCPDALSSLRSCVERCAAQRAGERLGELKLNFGEEQPAGAGDEEVDAEDSRRAEELAETRSQCQAVVARFDEQVGEALDDIAHIAVNGEIPGAVSMAVLEGLERVLDSTKLVLPSVNPLWPAGDVKERHSSASLRAATRAALAVETLRTLSDLESAKTSSRVGEALRAASTGEIKLAKKAEAIIGFLNTRSEEVNCVWARLASVSGVSRSSGRSISSLGHFWKLADDEVGPACGWGSAAFAAKAGESSEAKSVSVPIQTSPFVFERLAASSKQIFELSGAQGPAAVATAAAAKASLAELFAAAYEAERPSDLARLKRSGMSHLLQWLFDLSFLRIALSAAAAPGAGAYESLRELLTKVESVTFSDPVDRLLYQDVLKASVSNHVQGTKVLLAPFFLHNPLYGYLSQSCSGTVRSNSKPALGSENEGFELQTTFTAPLRPVLPRFPLLPVAMNVTTTSDLERLRLDPPARKAEPKAASSLMQQAGGLVGSGLGTLKFGAALFTGKPGVPGKNSEPMNV